MLVTCNHCHSQLKIPDEKLPMGQVVTIPCPKCKGKISLDLRNHNGSPSPPGQAARNNQAGPVPQKTLVDEVTASGYDAADKPFDFIEEGVKTALVCEQDPEARERAKKAAEAMGYHVTMPQSAREALKQMRFHVFDMVIVNEKFDTEDEAGNHVLRYIQRIVISVRRRMFVALLTDSFRTMDNMAAFTHSVNVMINTKNVGELDKILHSAVNENAFFYRVLNELGRQTGKW